MFVMTVALGGAAAVWNVTDSGWLVAATLVGTLVVGRAVERVVVSARAKAGQAAD